MRVLRLSLYVLSSLLHFVHTPLEAKEWSYKNLGLKPYLHINPENQRIGVAVIGSSLLADIQISHDPTTGIASARQIGFIELADSLNPASILGKTFHQKFSIAFQKQMSYLGEHNLAATEKPNFYGLFRKELLKSPVKSFDGLSSLYQDWRKQDLDAVFLIANMRYFKSLRPTLFTAKGGIFVTVRPDYNIYFVDLNRNIEFLVTQQSATSPRQHILSFNEISDSYIDTKVLAELKKKWLEPSKRISKTYSQNELENLLLQDVYLKCSEIANELHSEKYREQFRHAFTVLSVSTIDKILTNIFDRKVGGKDRLDGDFQKVDYELDDALVRDMCKNTSLIEKYQLPRPSEIKYVPNRRLKKSSRKR